MFSEQLLQFRFFGFDIRVTSSWILISLLLIWTFATSTYPSMIPDQPKEVYWRMGGWGLVMVIFSILAHELAHAIIAQYYDMPIKRITLFVFGGVAEMEGDPSHPKGEFLMAIAGPAMSALLGLIFWATGVFYEDLVNHELSAITIFLGSMAKFNLIVAIFNMVPAFPLDGGRALRAAIWHFKENIVIATRIASEAGAVFAYGLIAWGCYRVMFQDDFVGAMWMGLLGLFVHGSGQYAIRHTESRSLLSGKPVRDFMRSDLITVTPDTSITSLVDDYVYNYYHKSFPVVDHGKLVGIVSLESILMLDRKRWPWLRVATVMEPVSGDNTITPDVDAADALELLRKTGKSRLLITDGSELVGVLSLRDLADYLTITLKLDDYQAIVKRQQS